MPLPPDQIEQLMKLPLLVISGVIAADDRSGPMKIMREVTAGTNYLREAQSIYAHNPLISEVLAALFDRGLSTNPADFPDHHEIYERINDMQRMLGVDDVSMEYKEFLFNLGLKVAEAAGGGLFGTGEKISGNEEAFLLELRRYLGV